MTSASPPVSRSDRSNRPRPSGKTRSCAHFSASFAASASVSAAPTPTKTSKPGPIVLSVPENRTAARLTLCTKARIKLTKREEGVPNSGAVAGSGGLKDLVNSLNEPLDDHRFADDIDDVWLS